VYEVQLAEADIDNLQQLSRLDQGPTT
jgi:hypothetical protein